MILLIDNYDSFTYNLVQRIGELLLDAGRTVDDDAIHVARNDKITVDEARALNPSHVIISPGPGTPLDAGVSCDVIKAFAGRVPLLGVCLGHQCIGHVFGMTVDRNDRLMHGKTSPIHHDEKTIFRGLPNPFTATRYHSLVIVPDTFDKKRFEITAWTQEGEIMGLRARPGVLSAKPQAADADSQAAGADSQAAGADSQAALEGVQFHPESFMTLDGPHLLANFLGLPNSVAASSVGFRGRGVPPLTPLTSSNFP